MPKVTPPGGVMKWSIENIKKLQQAGGVFNFDSRSITDEGVDHIRNAGDKEAEFIDEYIKIQGLVKQFKIKHQDIYRD